MTSENVYTRGRNHSFLQKNMALMITLLLFCYLLFPILAPMLMNIGLDQPGGTIYRLYSPLCHQLAYRSWFLFGMQPYYPLAENNYSHLISYEQAFGQPASDFDTARRIIGNETYGYKIALCQRDVAIYGSLFLFGVIFLITGKKIHKIHLIIWLVLGVVPLGLDGFTQWINFLPDLSPGFAIVRESTPCLRSITGVTFGFSTGWYIFPAIQDLIYPSKTPK